jgi:hypothetical protein
MNTLVYSDTNSYPGKAATKYTAGYNWATGTEPPLLNAVNIGNNFSFNLYAGIASTSPASTAQNNYKGYANTGVRNGTVPQSPQFGYGTPYINVYKRITNFSWVTNSGPQGNGVAQNERGDWFTYDALTTADRAGSGIKLNTIPANPATGTYTFSVTTGNYSSSYTTGVIPLWPTLNISGSYNAAVFCYNQFDYTNDYEGTVYTAKSLFELPENIDNLVSFIPDQRDKTTLKYTLKIDWVREDVWNLGFSTGDKNTILSQYTDNGFGPSGTDYHTVTQVINNTFDWNKLFKETLERQRSVKEQHERYGQTTPYIEISVTSSD